MTSLSLDNREVMKVTGIKSVKTTEPTMVVASLDNSLIIIKGANLSVQNLSIDRGELDLTGLVNSITYSTNHAKRFSLRNLFK